ncbi:hypothetical protein BKA62DRAFT_348941 [Auriculariales sp. MPI-PUGE-AT-0066]|nr:hypothetical protein BKA62DRAFT_348941 [Auriculariales sp. MPI-PUGE-AT-0066]
MASSSSSSFSSMLGSMDTDAALAKLGLSREQLNGHTLQMRQFLSSDTTFTPKPPRLPATPAQPASSSQPTFSTPDNASSPVPRSRSMDHIAIPDVAATPQAQPHQTPSRTRKLSDADLSLPEERPSKRQRGEKVPGKPSSAAGPPPPPPYPTRVQYPSTSAHPSLPPTPAAHTRTCSLLLTPEPHPSLPR